MTEKSTQDLEDKYKPLFEKSENVIFKSVQNVNHRPHPYTVGAQHIKHASDKHGGRLGKETCDAIGCAFPGCGKPYSEHVYDTVLFLQLKKDVDGKVLQDELRPIADQMNGDGVEGICFVETKEKFRVK